MASGLHLERNLGVCSIEGEREKPDPVELANSLDAETLRSYLLEILKTDESWQSDFVRRFGKIDPTRLRLDFLEGVRATVREHSYRGYVDYRSASRCGYALSRFLDDYLAPIIDRLDEDAFSTSAALKLLDIYDQTQQMDMRLITLYGLVVNGQPRNDDQFRSWLRKLQKQSGNHWPGYEEEIEEALSGAGHKLHEFLAFTDQRSKLAQALEGYGSRYEFDHYRNLLAQDFPEEYLALYEKEVRGMLFGQAGSRNVYANAACLMRYMLKIPGGKPLVARIVAELREAYPRRRALMEELSQLDLSM